jgi:hypothetical protein|tara:strand:- start:71 stop:817 length:747 start_codon:yes stop_codon:yes gene_type:complete
MEPTIQGFLEFHGETLNEKYKEYLESLKDSRKDDIESITDKLSDISIDKPIKKKGRKCSLCGKTGHNRRTCPTLKEEEPKKEKKPKKKEDKPKIVQEGFDLISFRAELYDESCGESKCDYCLNDLSNNMLCNYDGSKYCYNCYKSLVIDKDEKDDINRNIDIHEKNCQCEECKTIPLSPKESKICNDLLTDDKNDYIIYENIEYSFDDSTNIITYDYEELGIWNSETESVEWYNSECENVHLQNLNKK